MKKTRKIQRTWQELSRDENNEVKIMKVIDFGLTKSARRKSRMRQMKANPTSPTILNTDPVGVVETIQGRLNTPDLARTRTRSELEDKKNKHKKNSEVAEPGSKKTNLTPLKLQEKKKMTSSTKVKTVSNQKR